MHKEITGNINNYITIRCHRVLPYRHQTISYYLQWQSLEVLFYHRYRI